MTTLQRNCLTLLMLIFSSSSFSGLLSVKDFNSLCEEGMNAVKTHLDLLEVENPNELSQLINQWVPGLDREPSRNYLHQAIIRTTITLADQESHRDAVEIVELLLDKGADPNLISPTGHPPLHRAVSSRNVRTVRALLSYGANANTPNKNGITPIDYARQQQNYSTTSEETRNIYNTIIEAITERLRVNQGEQQCMDLQPCEGAQGSLGFFHQ